MNNIKLSYRYRDYANYKNHGEVIFSNPENLSVTDINHIIQENLIDGQWFYASKWEVKDLHFDKYDDEIDHAFHEFDTVESTEEEANDERTILEFINILSTKQMLH